MTRRACWQLVVLALISITGCRQASQGDPGEVINLASLWEMTGQVAEYGEAAQLAVGLAVEDFNATRAPGSPRIRLIVQDTQSTPQGAAAAFQAAISKGRPIAILGPLTSGAAMVVSPLAERAKILLMTTASIPDLTEAGPYTYRIYPSDTFEAQEMARYARGQGVRSATVIYPQNDYGVGLDSAFALGAASDIAIKARIPYPPEQSDFKVIAARALVAQPEAVYAPGYPATIAPLARALRSSGFAGPIFSSLGIEDPSLFRLGGKAVDGIVYTVTSLPDSAANPKRARFEALFRDRFQKEAGFPALYGWDVASIVLESIRAGARTAEDLQRAFGEGSTFDGVTGRFTFDRNGDVRRTYALKRADSATKSFLPLSD